MRNPIYLTIGILLSTTLVFSQKKPLDHSSYDSWKSLQGTAISNDGKVVATLIAPQEGDISPFSSIRSRAKRKRHPFTALLRFTLSTNGQWTVGLVKAQLAERRQAHR